MGVRTQQLRNDTRSLAGLLLLRLYDALTLLPLLVAVLWLVWAISAVIEYGHWPTQYNPMSSQTAFGPLLEPICSYLTLGVIVLWPVWIGLTLSTKLRFIPLQFRWWQVALYAVGIVLFVLIGDKGGIMGWMWD